MSSGNTLPLVGKDVYVFKADRTRHFPQPKMLASQENSCLYRVEPKFTIRKRFNSEPKNAIQTTMYSPPKKTLSPISILPKPLYEDQKPTHLPTTLKTESTTIQTTIDTKRPLAKSHFKTLPFSDKPSSGQLIIRPANGQRHRRSHLRSLKQPRRSPSGSKKNSPEPRELDTGLPIAADICVIKYKDVLTPVEKDQIKMVQVVYYLGKRRPKLSGVVYSFDDEQGDLKVYAKDQVGYRYEVLDILGKGSFGQVFKAYDHKLKQEVALKIIKNRSKYTSQAMIEIKLLYQIRNIDPNCHYNIIKVKQSFMFRSHMCLTFQLLHMNLYDFLRLHKFKGFSLQLIHRFAIQILQALLLLSRQHIIHCDLKPQNIMLKQQLKSGIRLIDLGSSCLSHQTIYTYIQSRYYRAPEIILGVDYTTAIDMWSFGCILCELFTGTPIFSGESETQQMGMFVQLLGNPPKGLLDKARRKKFFDQRGELRNVQDPNGSIYTPGSKTIGQELESSNQDFIDLITRCFEWEAEKRITPQQALLHKWIQDLLPQDVKTRHLDQMKKQAPELFHS